MQSETKEVVAIFCSDLHLSLHPPIYRSKEPDWLKAMARPLRELKQLQTKYECPVICCGDVFHTWKPEPELINFAITNLPERFHTIAGQHDLPNHCMADLHRSALFTLHLAGTARIFNSTHCNPFPPDFGLRAFHYGDSLSKTQDGKPFAINVAVLHQYNWMPSHKHQKAKEKCRITSHRKEFKPYEYVFCGDNHIPFFRGFKWGGVFVNCGAMMIRKSDDNFIPKFWLLVRRKEKTTKLFHVIPYRISTEQDVYWNDAKVKEKEHEPSIDDLATFKQELEKLGESGQDVVAGINAYVAGLPNVSNRTVKFIEKILNDCQNR